MIQLDCSVKFVQAPSTTSFDDAIAVGGGRPSTLVERGALLQEFYDIRIIQPAGAVQRVPVYTLVQCKWSANPATSGSGLAKWLGTVTNQCLHVRHFPTSTHVFAAHFLPLPLIYYFVCTTEKANTVSCAHPDTVAFVYVAAHHLPTPRGQPQLNHSNVIVLDNDALMRLYGPTLCGSYQFLLRVESGVLTSSVAVSSSDSAGSSSAWAAEHDSS